MNKIDTVIGLCLISMSMQAQAIKWFNPQQSEIPCIQQRGWADEMKNSYARLPDRARAEVFFIVSKTEMAPEEIAGAIKGL